VTWGFSVSLIWSVASSVNSHLFKNFMSNSIRSHMMLVNVKHAWWTNLHNTWTCCMQYGYIFKYRWTVHWHVLWGTPTSRDSHLMLFDTVTATTASVSDQHLWPPACGLVMDPVSSNVQYHCIMDSYSAAFHILHTWPIHAALLLHSQT
jgi:hypothetical protein